MSDSGVEIPQSGGDRDALLARLAEFRGGDVKWRENRAFGLVYQHSEGHTEFLKAAHGLYMSANGLNPMAFKSLQRMEREVVGMTARMFHGDGAVTGSMTSGGTESLLLAVLTYRNRARRKRPWIRKPEIIVPESAHVALIKAGDYFDVKIVSVPCGPDYRADVRAMERRINRNTIALVGSAPCYPYGTLDPIGELGELAARRGLPLHVDACLGGFFLPWLGGVPPFDFRVPGVTSISADIHKYGYAAKGASTLLYRSAEWFRDQIFAEVDWCGGAYGGATMAGTRPGGPIAAAWASLHALGRNGYTENARAVMAVAARFREGIRAIPGLAVLGEPVMGVMAYGSPDGGLSLYAVADRLEKKGWHVDRLQRPESVHMILNPGHAAIVDEYLADLREAVDYVRAHPDAALEGSAPMYGLMAKMPLRRVVKKNLTDIFMQMYSQTGHAETEEDGEDTPAIPKPLLQLMRLKARLGRLFSRGGGA